MQNDILIENQALCDVNPLVCGSENCQPGHRYGPAIRDYYLLHYILSGRGTFQTPRGIRPVYEGQIFVIRPHEITTYTADTRIPWHYCWVGFDTCLPIEDLFAEDVLDLPECAHIFHDLASCAEIQEGREWYVCGKIYGLLSLLRQHSCPATERTEQYVRRAQNYIQCNYMKELRVTQIASFLNLERSYFSHIFKKHTGKSPQEYIVDFRLQKAAEMIISRGLRPGEAAGQTGYGDIVNFSRMFKRRFGVPPSRYRG